MNGGVDGFETGALRESAAFEKVQIYREVVGGGRGRGEMVGGTVVISSTDVPPAAEHTTAWRHG